jgi:hypothetical protein
MRHIRARRRFKAILIALLVFSFILFFESRVESFAPQIRNIVEYKVGEALGKNMKLSIGDLDGGIFRPFILNDVKIAGKEDSAVFSSFEIKSIRSNYRIWDVLLKGKEYKPILNMLREEPCIYVDFVTKNKELSGYVKLEGDMESADIQGYLILFEKRRIDINGKLKAKSFYVELRPRSGSLKIEGKRDSDGSFLTNIKADHLRFSGIDIVCEASLKNRVFKPAGDKLGGYVEGQIETKSLVLNYSLFPDVKASYRVYNGLLDIANLDVGKDLKVKGRASLRDPYNLNFTCMTDNASLGAVLSCFGIHCKDAVSGTLNAKIELKGPAKNLKTSARISVRQGTLGPLDFESLEAVLKGDGPIMRIEESRISRSSGHFSIAGEIDLRKIGKSTVFQQLSIVSEDNAIAWDGWNSVNIQGVQEITMTKRVNQDINVGFKKFMPDKQIDESMRNKEEMELEYKLQPNDSLKLMIGDDKNFFGLEHKDKF